MNLQAVAGLVGKHVTLVTCPTNQPVCPEAIVEIFSGRLHDVGSGTLIIRYEDGTQGIFAAEHVVGVVENLTLPQTPANH